MGGLSTTTTVDQLLAAFKAYGHVTDAMIITEKATGKPRGFAFIVFETADEVARVMAASVPWRGRGLGDLRSLVRCFQWGFNT